MALSMHGRLLAALGLSLCTGAALAEAPSNAELQQQIEELKQQIRILSEKLSGQPVAAEPDLGKQVETQARQIQNQQEQIEALAKQAEDGQKNSLLARTKLGGYGEMHYNNLDGEGGASNLDRIDFHRFVLFFGHDFSERVRFRSELEVEHALVKDTDTNTAAGGGTNPSSGEVELEQAYIEFDVNPTLTARGGLFLLPVGILNETHEPPTFFGVERNPVENAIIPTTWWAGGAGLTWRFGEGWALDAAVHEGLQITAANFAVRGGRQKTSNARADELASTVRLKWTGIPGLELAGTYQHQQEVTQNQNPAGGSADLLEAHAIYQNGPFGLRALYATWGLDGSGPQANGADEQTGYYVEPSWRLSQAWGTFFRYNQWDNQAGRNGPGNTEKTQFDVGVNYWPVENVVVKADYQQQDNDNGSNQDGFNLGIGYQF